MDRLLRFVAEGKGAGARARQREEAPSRHALAAVVRRAEESRQAVALEIGRPLRPAAEVIAERIPVSVSCVHDWIAGRTSPSKHVRERLREYGIDPNGWGPPSRDTMEPLTDDEHRRLGRLLLDFGVEQGALLLDVEPKTLLAAASRRAVKRSVRDRILAGIASLPHRLDAVQAARAAFLGREPEPAGPAPLGDDERAGVWRLMTHCGPVQAAKLLRVSRDVFFRAATGRALAPAEHGRIVAGMASLKTRAPDVAAARAACLRELEADGRQPDPEDRERLIRHTDPTAE